MKKVGLIAALVVAVFACSEQAGQMLVDAGEMMRDAGDADASMMPDGSTGSGGGTGTAGSGGGPTTDVELSCNKSATERLDEGELGARTMTFRWAEFDVDPGVTEVTTCHSGKSDAYYPYSRRDTCYRGKASWYRGTSTGFVQCGVNTDWDDDETFTDSNSADPLSITVHG